jgi:hypothetical protein
MKELYLPIVSSEYVNNVKTDVTQKDKFFYEKPAEYLKFLNKTNQNNDKNRSMGSYSDRRDSYYDEIVLLFFSSDTIYESTDFRTLSTDAYKTTVADGTITNKDMVFLNFSLENNSKDIYASKISLNGKIEISFKNASSFDKPIAFYNGKTKITKTLSDIINKNIGANESFGVRIKTYLREADYSKLSDYGLDKKVVQKEEQKGKVIDYPYFLLSKSYKIFYKNHTQSLNVNKTITNVPDINMPHKLTFEFYGSDMSCDPDSKKNLFSKFEKQATDGIKEEVKNYNTQVEILREKYAKKINEEVSLQERVSGNKKVEELLSEVSKKQQELLSNLTGATKERNLKQKLNIIEEFFTYLPIYEFSVPSRIFGVYERGLDRYNIAAAVGDSITGGITGYSLANLLSIAVVPARVIAGTAALGVAAKSLYDSSNEVTLRDITESLIKDALVKGSINISRIKDSNTVYNGIEQITSAKNSLVTGIAISSYDQLIQKISQVLDNLTSSVNVTESEVDIDDASTNNETTKIQYVLFGDVIAFIVSKLNEKYANGGYINGKSDDIYALGTFKVISEGKEYFINLSDYPISLPVFAEFLQKSIQVTDRVYADPNLFLQRVTTDLLKDAVEKIQSLVELNGQNNRNHRPYEIFMSSNYFKGNYDSYLNANNKVTYGIELQDNILNLSSTNYEEKLKTLSADLIKSSQNYTGNRTGYNRFIYIGSRNPQEGWDIYKKWDTSRTKDDLVDNRILTNFVNYGYNEYSFGEYLIDYYNLIPILLGNGTVGGLSTSLADLNVNLQKIDNANLLLSNMIQGKPILFNLPYQGSLKMFGLYHAFLGIGNSLYISPFDSKDKRIGFSGVYSITRTVYTYNEINLSKSFSNLDVSITHTSFGDGLANNKNVSKQIKTIEQQLEETLIVNPQPAASTSTPETSATPVTVEDSASPNK